MNPQRDAGPLTKPRPVFGHRFVRYPVRLAAASSQITGTAYSVPNAHSAQFTFHKSFPDKGLRISVWFRKHRALFVSSDHIWSDSGWLHGDSDGSLGRSR